MSEVIWKCFRCNLSFKDENIADMHKKISKHHELLRERISYFEDLESFSVDRASIPLQ